MRGFLLQDWVTIRRKEQGGAAPYPTVVQGQPFWLDLSDYRDVVAWLDVRQVGVADAGVNVQVTYQTAPFEDEALFSAMAPPIAMANGYSGLTVTQMLADVSPPLARYFRWMLSPSGATSAPWDITFRVYIAVNRPGYRTPTYGGPGGDGPIMMPTPISKSSGSLVSSLLKQGTSSSGSLQVPKKFGP